MGRGQAELPGRFVALQGFDPAHAEVGIEPLDGLVALETFEREAAVEQPFVHRDAPAVTPLQGDAAQAGDLIMQAGFQLPGQVARLVADALGDTLLLCDQQSLPEQQADQAQAQQQGRKRQASWPRGLRAQRHE
ncbi:hypothetical protein D3C86_1351070 [compost metagenome]